MSETCGDCSQPIVVDCCRCVENLRICYEQQGANHARAEGMRDALKAVRRAETLEDDPAVRCGFGAARLAILGAMKKGREPEPVGASTFEPPFGFYPGVLPLRSNTNAVTEGALEHLKDTTGITREDLEEARPSIGVPGMMRTPSADQHCARCESREVELVATMGGEWWCEPCRMVIWPELYEADTSDDGEENQMVLTLDVANAARILNVPETKMRRNLERHAEEHRIRIVDTTPIDDTEEEDG